MMNELYDYDRYRDMIVELTLNEWELMEYYMNTEYKTIWVMNGVICINTSEDGLD